jgi:hypothetical protein
MWLPALKPVYVRGLEQAVNAPASSLHSKLMPPTPLPSLPVKVKLALVLLAGFAG